MNQSRRSIVRADFRLDLLVRIRRQLAAAVIVAINIGITQSVLAQAFAPENAQSKAVQNGRLSPASDTDIDRDSKISGHVKLPDGKPAVGLVISARGIGALTAGPPHVTSSRVNGITDADGFFELLVKRRQVYMVGVVDDQWAAPIRADLVVQGNQSVEGIDFAVANATLIRGTVWEGNDRRPVARRRISIEQIGSGLPQELDVPHPGFGAPHGQFALAATTDDRGQYRFHVGPGSWQISLQDATTEPKSAKSKLIISDEREVINDIELTPIPTIRFSGKVIDPGGMPVIRGRVTGCYLNSTITGSSIAPLIAVDGTFNFERKLFPAVLGATDASGKLGGIIEIEPEQKEGTIKLAPFVQAHGRVLDEQGQPVAGRTIQCAFQVHEGASGAMMNLFSEEIVTDADGKFTLKKLLAGQISTLSLIEGDSPYRHYRRIKSVLADKNEMIELGDVSIPAPKGGPTSSNSTKD